MSWPSGARPLDRDPTALNAAAKRGSWGADLTLGEMDEQGGGAHLLQALTFYATAAALLDAQIARSESADQMLRGYAEEASRAAAHWCAISPGCGRRCRRRAGEP